MMNTIFSINRFGYYILRKLMFTKSQYLFMLYSVLGGYLLSLCIFMLFGVTPAFLIKALILVTIVIAPGMFEPTIGKYNGVIEYTLPVSSFERFLYILIRYVVLIPLIMLGLYMVLNSITGILPINGMDYFADKMAFSTITFRKLHVLFGIQSIYLVGELYFKQGSVPKTTLILIGGFIVISNLLIFILHMKFMNLDIQSSDDLPRFFMSLDIDNISWRFKLFYFLYFLFPFGMWIVSYFRIREKEI